MKAYLQEGGFQYRHFFAAAPDDPNFPGNYQFVLVDTEEKFGEMASKAIPLAKEKKLILAADTETTDLNHEIADLVGASLCFDETTAYYLPKSHRVGDNLPESVWPYFFQLLYMATVVPMYNARFDLRILREAGADIDQIDYYDVAVPLWHADTNRRKPGLKWGAKHFLGWDMTTYEEALGAAADLSFCDPKDASRYAGADALGTWHLGRRLEFLRKRHPFIMQLDNSILRPVMMMEETPTPIDLPRVVETRSQTMKRMDQLEEEVHTALGTVFKINAGNQLAQALEENGLDTGARTEKTRQMQTGVDQLSKIEDQHPVIPKIIEYKTLHKFLTSYCNSFMTEFNEEIGGIRFGYQTTTTPTGRLAAGGEKKNSFFASALNVQAVDKAGGQHYGAFPCDDPTEPNCFLGWKFVPEPLLPDDYDRKNKLVEGFSQERNIRSAFRAYPGHIWVHFDYMAQELRIPANLSGEPVWVEAFLNEEDIHRKVASLMWGEDRATEMRKYAKALNFGALYGGSKYTFSRTLNCTVEQAQERLDDWWSALNVLARWVRTSENRAKKDGYIETYFGRPRRVKHYFDHPKYSMQNFAKRTAVNTQVQGAGADIMKIGMLKVYEALLCLKKYWDDLKLLNCVHDELNFSMLNDITFVNDTCQKIKDKMQFEIPGWKVPMLVDCAIGDSWGNMFPMRFDTDSGLWSPTYDV